MTMPDGDAVRAVLDGFRAALLGLAARGGFLFLLAYLGTKLARSLGPERRHTIWLVVLVLLAVLPAARLLVPPVRLPLLDLLASTAPSRPGPVPTPPPASPGLRSLNGAAGSGGPDAPVKPPGGWILLAIAGAWAAGALVVAARPLAGHVALARLLRSDEARPGPEALLRALARETGVRRVRGIAHPRVTIPFALGVLRPWILLPPGWPGWSRQKLAAVLLHELAHLKRRDGLSNAAAQVACALVWFNPLAWIARALLHREAELSCDREVLSHGIGRTGYAGAIIHIVREAGQAPLRLSLPALGRKKLLRERIAHILFPGPGPRESSIRRARRLALALCLLSPLLLLSVSLHGADPLYGVWRTQTASKPTFAYRLSLNEDGSGRLSLAALPDVPTTICRYVIDQRWKDAQGYTWYHIRARWCGKPFILYTLIRLHPSATSCELTDSPLGYPAGFIGPPGDEKHLVYVRP